MKKLKISLITTFTAITLLFLSGCFKTMDPCRSELPWAKPAPWQTTSPGVGF